MNSLISRSIAIILFSCLILTSPSAAQPGGPPLPPLDQEISISDSAVPGDDEIIAFGNLTVGNFTDHTVSISNIGKKDLSIFDIADNDPLSPPFSILSHTCSNSILSMGESCTLTVRYEPTSAGYLEDTFEIQSDDADETTVIISVNGTGSGIPVPDITVSDPVVPPADLIMGFGQVPVTTQSDRTITIENTGNADLDIFNIGGSDPLVLPFSIENDNCSGNTVAPADTCTFTVRFAPAASGGVNDSFDIPSSDPDPDVSTLTFTVNGTGIIIPAPDITVSDSIGVSDDLTLPFGTLSINASQDAIVKITNDGSDTLFITGIDQGNELDTPFIIQYDSCSSASLEPADFCTFTVNFSPATLFIWNDSFDIVSNDSDESTITVMVSGRTNNPPTKPQLVTPQNSATGVGSSSAFTWNKSTDIDNDTINYVLDVCEDVDFSTGCISQSNMAKTAYEPVYYAGFGTGFMFIGVVFSGALRDKRKITLLLVVLITCALLLASCGGGGGGSSNPPNNGNNITRTASGLISGTTYFWKVTADDSKGGLAESPVWSFTTQ